MRYNKEFLYEWSKQKNVQILNQPEKINRDIKIHFNCIKCKKSHEKTFRQLVKTDAFCLFCTKENTEIKKNHIKWDENKICRFFLFGIIYYNRKRKKGTWILPHYLWWCGRWRGILRLKNISYQKLLKKYNFNFTRNIIENEKELINEFRKIYHEKGIESLSPIYLDKNHINIYNFHIRTNSIRYNIDKQHFIHVNYNCKIYGVSGCPSYWICEKLDILEERKQYLNKLPSQKTDEELIEIIKKQEILFKNYTQIDKTDYTTEMLNLHKRDTKKYNLKYFRKLLNFRQKNFPTRDGKFVCRSKAEFIFYHKLIKYQDIKEICYEHNIYSNTTWSIDWYIILNNEKKIGVEIWGHNIKDKSTHKRKNKYIERRNEKEIEWKKIKNIDCYGIEWEDCNNEEKMDIFFNEKLGLTAINNEVDIFKSTLTEEQQFKKEMYDIYKKNGYISTMLLNSSQQHRMQRYFGKNLNGLLDILYIDKNKNQELININSAKKQAITKKNNLEKKYIDEFKNIINKLYIVPGKKRRINQSLFLEITNNKKVWYNSVFPNFENLIHTLNKTYNFELVIAEKTIEWEIKCIDNKYYLKSVVYDEFIEMFELYLSNNNNILTIPYKTIIDNYKLGVKANFIRSNKDRIPDDYISKLNKLSFVWNEIEYKEYILFRLIIELKNTYNKKITQKMKTKDLIENELFINYFPLIGIKISQMRQGIQWKNVKKKIDNLNDKDINNMCDF